METVMKWAKRVTFGVTLLFIVELIFGYTGTILYIGSEPIRVVLFAASAVLLYLYSLLYVIVNKVKIFSRHDKNSVFGTFRLFDWVLLLFVLSTAVSLFIIPRLTGTSLYYAKCEAFDCLCMLLICFPVCFLIRRGELHFARLEKILYWLCAVFSLYHTTLYVGENMHGGFIQAYFNLLKSIFGPQTTLPDVILGHGGYPRVMFITSIYIIVGMYLIFKRLPRLRVYDYIVLGVHVAAFLTTMTKSIWYGVIVGLGIFSALYIIKYLRRKNIKEVLRYVGLVLGIIALVFALNATVFDNMVVVRFQNSFTIVVPPSSNGSTTDIEQMDRQGAAISNSIKIEQTEKLLSKWEEHPLFGWGYGAYIEDYIRSTASPFSYEMQFPALLMKTGIVGVGLLLLFLLAMMINLRKAKKNGGDTTASYAWIFLLVSFAVCVQTNPLLLNYNGMSLIVLLVAACANIERDGYLIREKRAKNLEVL